MELRERYRGTLLGLACGDAVGAAVEFRPRGSFEPLTDMVGGGPFALPAGAWTDDTSMALCLAESLVETRGFDALDQMRRYVRWWKEGHLSSTGTCFDVGMTVHLALTKFLESGDPYSGTDDPRVAGNGSIMRIAPVALYYHPHEDAVIERAAESSMTTHGAAECVDACRLLGSMLHRALSGAGRDAILAQDEPFGRSRPKLVESIQEIASGAWRAKGEDAIEGSGRVVRSLEAATWCFAQARDFRDAVLRAANLGDDADSTAAVCGQIAGAYWGAGGIPGSWLDKLAKRETIAALADRLLEARVSDTGV